MRTVIAVGVAVCMVFIGFHALGTQAQLSEDAAVENGTNDSEAVWNMTTELYGGGGTALAPALVWMGVAAVVLVSLGVLLTVAPGGGR